MTCPRYKWTPEAVAAFGRACKTLERQNPTAYKERSNDQGWIVNHQPATFFPALLHAVNAELTKAELPQADMGAVKYKMKGKRKAERAQDGAISSSCVPTERKKPLTHAVLVPHYGQAATVATSQAAVPSVQAQTSGHAPAEGRPSSPSTHQSIPLHPTQPPQEPEFLGWPAPEYEQDWDPERGVNATMLWRQ